MGGKDGLPSQSTVSDNSSAESNLSHRKRTKYEKQNEAFEPPADYDLDIEATYI